MIRIPILQPGTRQAFPPAEFALDEPNGLLAAGGDLSPQRLLDAYRQGIFPWYSDGTPILWWSPDPRTVFATDRVHVPSRLRRWLRRCDWRIAADTDFSGVVRGCAAPRAGHDGTWITAAMRDAYVRLHELGHAHSVEVRADGELVGGIYGVAVGRMFFGESMFSRTSNASKVALLALCSALSRWHFPLLDAQVASPHLFTLGACEMPRREFLAQISALSAQADATADWRARWPADLSRAANLADTGPRPQSAAE